MEEPLVIPVEKSNIVPKKNFGPWMIPKRWNHKPQRQEGIINGKDSRMSGSSRNDSKKSEQICWFDREISDDATKEVVVMESTSSRGPSFMQQNFFALSSDEEDDDVLKLINRVKDVDKESSSLVEKVQKEPKEEKKMAYLIPSDMWANHLILPNHVDQTLMVSNDKVSYLSGDNYKGWKESVLLHLECLDLDYALRKDEPTVPVSTSTLAEIALYERLEWSNRLSMMFIKSHIMTSIRESIPNCKNVKDLMKAIDEQFESYDKAFDSTLMSKLTSMKLTGVKAVREHIMQMRDIVAQLKSLKIKISNNYLEVRLIQEMSESAYLVTENNKQAFNKKGKGKSNDAMKDDMGSMANNQVLDFVKLPNEVKPIGCKCVFKTKKESLGNIERYKAKLVANGFSQKERINYRETFSPVSKKNSFRIIVALVAHFDLNLHQMDEKKAFLNGDLEEKVYMKQLEGFISNKGEHLNVMDQCIYHKVSGSKIIFLVLYVYDILLATNDMRLLHEVKQFLSRHFDMKDMGEAPYVISIKIHKNISQSILGLSQKAYINKILERFPMKVCSPSVTLIVKSDKFNLNQCPKNELEREQIRNIPHASTIGSLMYAQVYTRPDITFAVGMLGRYQNSNFAGCVYSQKSTSGYIFLLAGGAISWRSAKQSLVATSTMEAKFVSCFEATSQEYEKKKLKDRNTLEASKRPEQRKVEDEDLESVQLIGEKKKDDCQLKTEKLQKKDNIKEEKVHKTLSINEFLKLAEGKTPYFRHRRKGDRPYGRRDVERPSS
ncbi:uncharacterized protein LOC110429389 [Herrania umbratica]|uniref:Uncharacterized protein LOC110429389 n=1 Tax=Herrania umbratica TaxID=108875 RepID=A0A6J1BNP3_9ROSI|nr:uncharacterized protein LOC110429389 [Herrania umbratica]